MIDTQAIRSKILYLALRGKLTNQNPLEGSGHSLIEDNNSVLSTCSDDIKKRVGKGCKPIKPEDCLFEIPETWCWERFGNLVINFDSLRQPVTKSDRKKLIGRYDYYGATGAIDRVDDYIFDGDYLMIGEDGGNFFVSRDNSFIARGRFWANNHVHVLQPIICDIVYLKRCLDAYDLPKMGLVYGIGAPKLNQAKMNSIPIPVPPLAEQHRIVEQIEQAFSALDTIDTLQAQYADNLTVLKSKLIDAAIQGKLTEQLTEDGTAEELYQQIQAEKQALIRAGKIKKEKPLPEIAADEIPFEIPNNWKWVRLSSISKKITDGTHHSPINTQKGEFMYVTAKNVKDNGVVLDDITYVAKPIHEEIYERCNPEKGDVLLIKDGATTGIVTVNNVDAPFSMLSSVALIKPMEFIDPWFVVFAMRSSWFYRYIRSEMTGVGITRVVLKQIQTFTIPLPPLAEQKRIVAKLETLLQMCEGQK